MQKLAASPVIVPGGNLPARTGTLAARMEEAALNATVVREQMLYDGWLVRWAPAAARRARSINVIAPPRMALSMRTSPVVPAQATLRYDNADPRRFAGIAGSLRAYAREIMGRLLPAGFDLGARAAYLRVEYMNAPARRLYALLGFSDRYTYWYRTHQHE